VPLRWVKRSLAVTNNQLQLFLEGERQQIQTGRFPA